MGLSRVFLFLLSALAFSVSETARSALTKENLYCAAGKQGGKSSFDYRISIPQSCRPNVDALARHARRFSYIAFDPLEFGESQFKRVLGEIKKASPAGKKPTQVLCYGNFGSTQDDEKHRSYPTSGLVTTEDKEWRGEAKINFKRSPAAAVEKYFRAQLQALKKHGCTAIVTDNSGQFTTGASNSLLKLARKDNLEIVPINPSPELQTAILALPRGKSKPKVITEHCYETGKSKNRACGQIKGKGFEQLDISYGASAKSCQQDEAPRLIVRESEQTAHRLSGIPGVCGGTKMADRRPTSVAEVAP